ncbi:MAG: small basic protein [Planctomycetes bacterium]|nr:small basic protein [Planctomycetota bacterium]
MSLHRSLKTKPGALNEHRNVLTRAERIARLLEQDRFQPDRDSPLGLVKVANRSVATGKKKKAAKEQETAEGTEATEPSSTE